MVNWSTPNKFDKDDMTWLEKPECHYISPMDSAISELEKEKDYSRLGEIARKWLVEPLALLCSERNKEFRRR